MGSCIMKSYSRHMYNNSYDPVTQSLDGPPVRPQSAAGHLEPVRPRPQSAAGRLEPSAQEGFPAPKLRMSKSMDEEKMVPIEKRDFAYESEQLEDKFRVLRRDVDRFLNEVPHAEQGDQFDTFSELRDFAQDLIQRLKDSGEHIKKEDELHSNNARLVNIYQKRQAKSLGDTMTRKRLVWNSSKRRVEPEGPNELEKADSQSKETKIAELLKRLDSRRELPAIEEEQEEDVDVDIESAVDEATPAAITETNNDNVNVVAERQLVAAVATSSERKLVAAVATSSESTQTDTARKLSRSTQTAKPKNREDSTKVMACLMLSTVNDIMAAVMKAFHNTTYRELPGLYDVLWDRLTQLEDDVRFYGFPIDKAFEAARQAHRAAASGTQSFSGASGSTLIPEEARLINQGVKPPGQSDEESEDEADDPAEEMPIPTFTSGSPKPHAQEVPVPTFTSRSGSPPLPGVAKLLAQGINPADAYKDEDADAVAKVAVVKPQNQEQPEVAKAKAPSAAIADGRSLEDLVPGRDDALIRELLQREAQEAAEARKKEEEEKKKKGKQPRPVTAKPPGADKRLVVKMQKPIKAPERPIAESPREEAEDVDVPAPRFVSSSPPLPTVAKMMSQGINPADAYKEEGGDNKQRSSSPPLPGVAKLLAQGINPADEYKEEEVEAQKKGAGSGVIPKTKPPKAPAAQNKPKTQTPKSNTNVDFSKLQPGKDDEVIRQILQEEAEAKAAAAKEAEEKAKREGKKEEAPVTGKPPLPPGARGNLKVRMTKRLNKAIAARPPREPKVKTWRSVHVETMPHRRTEGQQRRNHYLQDDAMPPPMNNKPSKYAARKAEKPRKVKQMLMIQEEFEDEEDFETPYFEPRRPREMTPEFEENFEQGRPGEMTPDFEDARPFRAIEDAEPMMPSREEQFEEMAPEYFDDAPNYPVKEEAFPPRFNDMRGFQKMNKSNNAGVRPKEPKNAKPSKRAPVKEYPARMIPNMRNNNKYSERFMRDEERPRIPAAVPREEDLQLPRFVSTSPPVPAAAKREARIENEETTAPSSEEYQEAGAVGGAAAPEPKQQNEKAKETAKSTETKTKEETTDENDKAKETANETEKVSLALTKTFKNLITSLQDDGADLVIKIETSRRKKLEPMSKPVPLSAMKPSVRTDNKPFWSKIPVLKNQKPPPKPQAAKSAEEKKTEESSSAKKPVATQSAAENRKDNTAKKPAKPAPQQSRLSLPPIPTSMVGQQEPPEWTSSSKLPEFKSDKRLPDFNFKKLPGKKFTYDAKSKIGSRRSKDKEGFLPPIRK